jgi:hypothetical protein
MRLNPYNIGQPQNLYDPVPKAGGNAAAAKTREVQPARSKRAAAIKTVLEGALVVGMFSVIILAILALKLAIWMPFLER